MIREQLVTAVEAAIAAAGFPLPASGVVLDVPKARDHGDFATNAALQLAKPAGRPPREVAEAIQAHLMAAGVPHLADVDIAGPGFLNLKLAPTWLHELLRAVVAAGRDFGSSTVMVGQNINLEFVSANPTGPIHAGGGRWIAVGDALAKLLATQGAAVHREYYLNDTGNQLNTFRASLYARYTNTELPEDGYVGQYMIDIADALRQEHGDQLDAETLCEFGLQAVIAGIRDDLARIGVHFETWFSERTLHANGDVVDVLQTLDAKGVTYAKDGAIFLRSSELGDDRDRVLLKSDGTTTYLCNDFAYHRNKFSRGFSHLINIWGSDHHGQVKSLQVGVGALMGTVGEPEIILGQLVKLLRTDAQSGEKVEIKLSKRAGNIITLADILDEVDADVARMTFLLQSLDTKQTFDLDMVTSQSMDNPVYYVQMAHARIASIARKAADAGVERRDLASVDLSLLVHDRETELLRALAQYPDVLAEAAVQRAPHRLTHWVLDFAALFHGFYRDCRVLGVEPELTQARLWLGEACRVGLSNALAVLGVSAPESMARLAEEDAAEGIDGEVVA